LCQPLNKRFRGFLRGTAKHRRAAPLNALVREEEEEEEEKVVHEAPKGWTQFSNRCGCRVRRGSHLRAVADYVRGEKEREREIDR
jgi:hypothetical protein